LLTPRDPEFARDQLLAHFSTLPALRFDPRRFPEVAYAEPKLIRPRELFNANRPHPDLHPGLAELFKCFQLGSEKLQYGRTDRRAWDTYFRFGSDRLVANRRRKGSYSIHAAPDGMSKFVNDNRALAFKWFRTQLVPLLSSNPQSHAYLLGDPGSGKSTLMKYLINTSFTFLREASTIMSRFEFLKFRYNWCNDIDFRSDDAQVQVRRKLSEYISFIILRDVLWARSYVEDDDGRRARAFDSASLRNAVAVALRSLSPSAHEIQKIAQSIDDSLGQTNMDYLALRSVPHEFRVLIAKQLAGGFALILVLDGLDCISMEDSDFESVRSKVLDLIMRNRTNLTTFDFEFRNTFGAVVYSQSVAIASSVLFVMRESTFYLHEDGLKHEVSMAKPPLFRVGPIDPEAAIYNVVNRATEIWASRSRVSDTERHEVLYLLVRATFLALRFINRAVGAQRPNNHILGIFCGNVRILFQFMARLLRWFLDDAIREGLLRLTPETTVRDIFVTMTGAAGLEVLRRRSYRVVEILLFSDVPWFENQVSINQISSYARRRMKEHDSRFQDNGSFSGVVDNIFNYHSLRYARSDDQHCLLEKIRIVQILEDGALTSDELAAALYRRLGYVSPNLHDTLTILVRTQMIRVSVQADIYFSPTSRGQTIVQDLARNLAYLEHVFHRTLFPSMLIDKIEDERRMRDVHQWTTVSIRNAFIFLSYLKFVESNDANGKSVPGLFRIFDDTRNRVVKSIRRILYAGDGLSARLDLTEDKSDARRAAERRILITRRALRMIENTINEWEQAGCLAPANRPAGPTNT
jgi:hypothetical protein